MCLLSFRKCAACMCVFVVCCVVVACFGYSGWAVCCRHFHASALRRFRLLSGLRALRYLRGWFCFCLRYGRFAFYFCLCYVAVFYVLAFAVVSGASRALLYVFVGVCQRVACACLGPLVAVRI